MNVARLLVRVGVWLARTKGERVRLCPDCGTLATEGKTCSCAWGRVQH